MQLKIILFYGGKMKVRKKYVVQKSFRIDEKVERDLGILAELTDRSQNDLVNVAITELLQDNIDYFLQVAVLEHFMSQLDSGYEEFDPFDMGGLFVEMKYIDTNGAVSVHSVVHGDEDIDDYTKEFDSDISDELEEYLKNFYVYINRESEDVKAYLDNRVDYREYVKIRK